MDTDEMRGLITLTSPPQTSHNGLTTTGQILKAIVPVRISQRGLAIHRGDGERLRRCGVIPEGLPSLSPERTPPTCGAPPAWSGWTIRSRSRRETSAVPLPALRSAPGRAAATADGGG